MILSRRHLLIGAGSSLIGACSTPSTKRTMLDTQLDALYSAFLQESPHNATAYGLDTGTHAALRTRWPERSREHAQRLASHYAVARSALYSLADAGLDPQQRATREATLFALDHALEGALFSYGDQTLMPMIDQEATPYPINQMIGLAASGPQLLVAQQPLGSAADQQAFIERLAALAPAIDAETRWFRDDAARGVRPPQFILATMKAQLESMLATPPAQARVATAFAKAARDGSRIVSLLEKEVYPAAARQRDAVTEALSQATDAAGVAHLPDGERYYAWALRMSTSTTMTPREVHTLGQELSRDLAAQMEALLARQGMTQGTVGQRLAALAGDARHRFASDDTGRGEAIAYCNAWVARLRAQMPQWSRLDLKAPVRVERAPPEREAGAAGAYMALGAFDGSRPSVFYLNLRDTATWPRWTLPTLVSHETLPGHVWQEAFEMEVAKRHPIRSLLRFNGYSEGWALYAERLVDEAGFYADDPLARLGHLQAQQLRATRLVVDTGLHAFGWSRERAIQTLANATGRPLAAVRGEIDRYCVKPGQACGYMIGQRELLRMREQWSKERRGDRVDFNDAVLRAGNLPLTVLDRVLASGPHVA
jgi:uncharacterized protein (DUF885 family)